MKKIVFYCHSGFGIGHMQRTLNLARPLAEDHEVYLVYGGIEYPYELGKVKIIALPQLVDDETRLGLMQPEGRLLDEIKEERKLILLCALIDIKPDIFFTEHFPFFRHNFAFELLPALEYIKRNLPKTYVLGSLGAFLGTNYPKHGYQKEVNRLIREYYDYILVHSDPTIETIDEEFSIIEKNKIIYTGYAVNKDVSLDSVGIRTRLQLGGKKLIVASVGGGSDGFTLLKKTILSKEALEIPSLLLIFYGPCMSQKNIEELQRLVKDKDGVQLFRFQKEFLSYLNAADLSISMGGYNTSMDILLTGVKALIFCRETDNEQISRAKKLEKLGFCTSLTINDLTPDLLRREFGEILPKKSKKLPNLEGVRKTKEFIDQLSFPKKRVKGKICQLRSSSTFFLAL